MASIEELAKQKIRLYETAPENLATEAKRIEAGLWRELLPIIQDLEVDSSGNIIQSDNNIRRIASIIESFNTLLAGKEYQDAVRTFLGTIDKNVELTDEIAKNIEKGFTPSQTNKNLLRLIKLNALDNLIGAGIRSTVSLPFAQQLIANVAARAPLREAVKSLRLIVEGDKDTDGRLAAHIKTTSTTAQSVADRSYSAAVYEELGVQWYRYIGGEIKTTRPFCEHRLDEIFHVKEIEAWGNGKNAGGIDDIKKGTWSGRIEGTDSRSIFVNLGGWNCRHSIVPVPERRVPETVKQRARNEGYI
jgi:hypothetical protein